LTVTAAYCHHIEERVGGATQLQYVWSPIGPDAPVLRDSNPVGGVLTVRCDE
jgi:hypothetical protein